MQQQLGSTAGGADTLYKNLSCNSGMLCCYYIAVISLVHDFALLVVRVSLSIYKDVLHARLQETPRKYEEAFAAARKSGGTGKSESGGGMQTGGFDIDTEGNTERVGQTAEQAKRAGAQRVQQAGKQATEGIEQGRGQAKQGIDQGADAAATQVCRPLCILIRNLICMTVSKFSWC
jgi:hypothetical protein